MVLSTETCFHWASAWFWKEGWLSCGLTSFMQTPVDSRGRDHSASPSFPQSESPWPALLANTIRWNQNHCRSYLSWAASQKYIGGFYILIKCSNINTIFASSQLLPSEHSQLGLRKFLWFWLNTNVVNFTVTVWPVPFLSPSHLHLPRTSPHPPTPTPCLCSSGENSFPGSTVGLTCLCGSPLTQWLMVGSAASLDLVNIRNCSQISVISDSLWAEKWDSLPDTKASGLG